MTNSYFNHNTPIARFTTADATRLNNSLKAVEAGFDKLPSAIELSQGSRNYSVATNVGNAYSITVPFVLTSYPPGLQISFFTPSPNTQSATLNANNVGQFTIKRFDGSNLLQNDIRANSINTVISDGSSFRLTSMHGGTETLATQSASAAASSASAAATSAVQAASSALSAGNSAATATSAANTSSAILSSSRFGFRNIIINPLFWMSQRLGAQTSGQSYTYSAGTYIRDRWKAGPSGISYIFNTSIPGITITAGSLQQIIQGRNLPFIGAYTLSWSGTSAATVNGVSVQNGGQINLTTSYQGVTVSFGTGTLHSPQFEYGAIKTQFEWRPTDYERQTCFQYYQKSYSDLTVPGTVTVEGVNESIAVTQLSLSQSTTSFAVPMRATPSVTIYNPGFLNTTGSIFNGETSGSNPVSVGGLNDRSFLCFANTVQFTVGHRYRFHWIADAEL